MKIFSPVDGQKNQFLNVLIHPASAAPGLPSIGQVYYDTTTEQLLVRGTTAWALKATDSALLSGQNAAFYLNRANHTGSQPASTITDLATAVKSYRLDEFADPTSDIPMDGHTFTGLGSPIDPNDAATKGYVDNAVANAAAGIDSKPSVRTVAASNIPLSGTQTVDGVSVNIGDRVLVRNQSTASQNGVYVAAAGAWTRAIHEDDNAEMTPGAFWFVEEGTAYGKTQWRIENTGSITLGSTAIAINQFGAATSYIISDGLSLNGSTLAVRVVAGGGITSGPSGLQIDTSVVARKKTFTVGNGSLTTIPLAHNLGTTDVAVSVRLAATNEGVMVDWVAADANTVNLIFTAAPAANAIKAVVVG